MERNPLKGIVPDPVSFSPERSMKEPDGVQDNTYTDKHNNL
ncbi:hypothetical protein [Flagellimonas alvinocaridis]|nr:hypothetical protein [Allomuricauda alvinocaridis]